MKRKRWRKECYRTNVMKRFLHRINVWVCLLASTGLSLAQSPSKIAPDLLSLLNGLLAPVNVVVQFNATPGLLQITKLVGLGGVITQQYSSIPSIAVTLPAAAVSVLALD